MGFYANTTASALPITGRKTRYRRFSGVVYGTRYYSPTLSRWISRDPINEKGGINLYVICGNDGVNAIDAVGQASYIPGGAGYGWMLASSPASSDEESVGESQRDPSPKMTYSYSDSGYSSSLDASYEQTAEAGRGSLWPDSGICNSGHPYPSHVEGWLKSKCCNIYRIDCIVRAFVKTWVGPTTLGYFPPTVTMGSTLSGDVMGSTVSSGTVPIITQDSSGVWSTTLNENLRFSTTRRISSIRTRIYFIKANVSVGTGPTRASIGGAGFSERLKVTCIKTLIGPCP